MGWVWKDEEIEGKNVLNNEKNGFYSTKKIVRSNCRTEEVEPGKFLYKCEKTEQILRDCVGRPTEVIESNKEYTEEDVTDKMKNGSHSLQAPEMGPFGFPGLRGDIDAIERNLLGGLSRFFDAAEEMKNGFFDAIGRDLFKEDSASMSSPRRGIPIEDHPPKEASKKIGSSGEFDLSGMAKDV